MPAELSIAQRFALSLLLLYKYLFSPLFAGSCRFLPSCADYARDAIVMHGGEATAARDAYLASDERERASLRVFLVSLSREAKLFAP